MMDPAIVKNRVMMSFADKASTKIQKQKGKTKVSGGWQKIFMICINQKSYDDENIDDQLLAETELPAWMEMDTLYFFKYDKKGDKTEYLKKITGRQMLMVELVNDSSLKGNFNIHIELKQKMYFFGFKFATLA